ncbi:MCE family protein [Aureibaculum algae]|uniref:MCE family protein n=1 Tax=Aureibaculum algae TaxID=2584122 RepID=A0A5B7TXE3_9FLAO|nr:MlaD family protein [Aureibaculum algae]QCX39382.1 MCE family protein [Aureibaculum algae]
MQQTKTQKFKLGLFIIVSTLLLIIALYFIGNKQNIFGKTFKISAVFNNVNGLQLGNNVRYSGINVGTVKSIEMINDTTICVDMIVEDKILQHLKKNALAAISSDGLVGSMIINIVPVKESSEALMSGDTIKSFSKISTSDMMSTLNTTNENAALLTSDLLKITTEVNQGKGTLGMLINDESLALNIKETFLTLKSASISASETIDKLNKIINSVNYNESVAAVLLSDSISAKKMKSIIQNLDYSSSKIDSVLTNINNVVIGIKSGDGALNYMINDTVFVKNIDSTMMNLKDGSTLLNENLEALKHNFLFRGYFKKLEKKKLKENNKDN